MQKASSSWPRPLPPSPKPTAESDTGTYILSKYASAQWRSQEGHSDHAPPQMHITRGQHIFFPSPKPRRVPWNRLGPGPNSGLRGTDQDSRERIRAPRDGSGLAGTNQGPRDGSGPVGQSRATQHKPGPRRTDQGPVGRIRAHRTDQGPVGMDQEIRTPWIRIRARRTIQNLAG